MITTAVIAATTGTAGMIGITTGIETGTVACSAAVIGTAETTTVTQTASRVCLVAGATGNAIKITTANQVCLVVDAIGITIRT
jgi:hypothetical protein